MKTVSIDFKRINNVVNKETVKKTTFKQLNSKINNLIPVISTLVSRNQCNVDKQNLEKRTEDVDKTRQIIVV